ncbi:MAG: MgtC/SapB family protein [Polyangiaceae bacterium]|nr:MgtC/SapB family protein [Polyangiaceae bacterium]
MILPWDLLLRVSVGTALGGVIGYERDIHGRPAGLRTHMIVGLASATFMVVSTNFVYYQHFGHSDLVEVDASRIAASIVTGMGFLAGGAILRTGLTVQGLTTAAALWLVGAIGMASGSGMFALAVVVTALGMLSLTILRRFEDKDARTREVHKVELVLDDTAPAAAVADKLRALGLSVSTLAHERKSDKSTHSLVLEVRAPVGVDTDRILAEFGGASGVRRIRVERIG